MLVLAQLAGLEQPAWHGSGFAGFVTREGDRLMEEGREFRFISVNQPDIAFTVARDGLDHLPTVHEQDAVLATVAALGGRVLRLYVITAGATVSQRAARQPHVMGPGVFSESTFRALDRLLVLAHRRRVRVIINLVNGQKWHGGAEQYLAFRGYDLAATKDAEAKHPSSPFFSDRRIIDDFRRTVEYVLTRRNHISGLAYNEDPAVLGWCTGNEIKPPPAWTRELASLIKSLAPRQLMIDGRWGVDAASLADPHVDVVTNNIYGDNQGARARANREATRGRRPLIITEFGLHETHEIAALLAEVQANGTAGATIWALAPPYAFGGFRHQGESYCNRANGICRRYCWPGFPTGDSYDELGVIGLLRRHAAVVQGRDLEPLPPPEAPVLLPSPSTDRIVWRRPVHARWFTVERAVQPAGPWTVVGERVLDSDMPHRPFADPEPPPQGTLYYRVSAANESGTSPPSQVRSVREAALDDRLLDAGQVWASSPNLRLLPTGGATRTLVVPGLPERLVWRFPGAATVTATVEVRGGLRPALSASTHERHRDFSEVSASIAATPLPGGMTRLQLDATLPAGTMYVTLTFADAGAAEDMVVAGMRLQRQETR